MKKLILTVIVMIAMSINIAYAIDGEKGKGKKKHNKEAKVKKDSCQQGKSCHRKAKIS